MKLRLRYFAALREALGAGETVEVPAGTTVAALRDGLIARGGAHAQALARERMLRCAINQTMAEETQAIPDGAEVAFFAPVTGG